MTEGFSRDSLEHKINSKDVIEARRRMIRDGNFNHPKTVREALRPRFLQVLADDGNELNGKPGSNDDERLKASGVSYNPADVLDTFYYSYDINGQKPALLIIENPKATDPNRKYKVLAIDESHFRNLHTRHFSNFNEAQEACQSALDAFLAKARGYSRATDVKSSLKRRLRREGQNADVYIPPSNEDRRLFGSVEKWEDGLRATTNPFSSV